MRITLNLDDNVHASLKSIADRHNVSMGEVASGLIKKALVASKPKARIRNGVHLFTPRPGFTGRTTPELVKHLRDE